MTQTIAQMTPKGAVIASTDLFEADSGTAKSYSVTGAQIAQGASRIVTASIYEKMRRFYRESRKNNPHYNAVMTSPPTIVVTSSQPGGLTKSYQPQSGNGASAFFQTGGTPANYVSGTRYPLVTLTNGGVNGNCGNGQNAVGWRVKVKVDAIAPCFRVLQGGNNYRFVIDGQYVNLSGTPAPNGGYSNYIQLTFAARGQHEIWIEGDSSNAFYGLYVLPTECACPPQAGLTWLVLGDSITAATSSPALAALNDGFAQVLGDCFGAGNLYMSGSGGEGILNPANTGAGYTLRQRLPWDFLPCDVCVIAVGTNDSTYSATALEAEIQFLLSAIRTTYAFAGPIFFLGVPANASGPSAAVLATEAAYLAAVTTFNDPDVFFIPTANASPESMLFGTGYAGATNNSGNSDWAVSTDATHPTLEGHYYDGSWWADRIFNTIQNLA